MKNGKEIGAMKAPNTLSKLCLYILSSALFLFFYATLTHLLGMSRRPTTIEQFLVLFMCQFGTSVMIDFYINRKKKSPAPPEIH